MTSTPVVLAVIGGYVWLLFGIALRSERRGVRRSGLIYTLSLGVYCTSWTFYGSVGRAAHSGVDFLPIYLGPTLVFCLGGSLLARMIRVSKASRITSIADFVSTRYGRSAWLAGLVTLVMLAGSVPYIALQLQAVAESLTLLLPPAGLASPPAMWRWRPPCCLGCSPSCLVRAIPTSARTAQASWRQ